MLNSFLSQEEIQALIKQLNEDDSEVNPLAEGEDEGQLPVGKDHWEDNNEQRMVKTCKLVFNKFEPKTIIRKDSNIQELSHVTFDLKVVLGETVLTVGELLNLKQDSIIALDRLAGENARLYANDNYLADGEIIVLNDCFAFRIHLMGEGKKQPAAKPQEEEQEEQ